MKLRDIMYESGCGVYFVFKTKRGNFEVYRNGRCGHHSVRVAPVGYTGQNGIDKCKLEIQGRLSK